MYRAATFVMLALMLTLAGTTGFAQLQPAPRAIQKVADPSMVIEDRGSKLEVIPTKRAVQHMLVSGRQVIDSVFPAERSAPINPQQLGVVFNHAMQVEGYITGEIAFEMKDGLQATDWLDATTYPGLAKLTEPNVYLVLARTPSEFVEVLKRLQERTDMEWVEPIITYGVPKPTPDTR
jgi:hypothetical protein